MEKWNGRNEAENKNTIHQLENIFQNAMLYWMAEKLSPTFYAEK